MMGQVEVCRGLFYQFDCPNGSPIHLPKTARLAQAQEHILSLENGKDRLLQSVAILTPAFALSVPNERALAVREEVGFYQAVRNAIAKTTVEVLHSQMMSNMPFSRSSHAQWPPTKWWIFLQQPV